MPFEALSTLNFDKFREILSFPTWWYIKEAVIRTRSYQEGLEGACSLLKMLNSFKSRVSPRFYQRNHLKIRLFIVDLMDRLDMVEECRREYYLLLEDFKESSALGERGHLIGHYLWCKWRNSIIDRKIHRIEDGHKIHRHHPQGELSEEEIEDRFAWICKMANEGRKRGQFILAWIIIIYSVLH